MDPVVSSALVVEIEEALSQVGEIRAARVVTSSGGQIQEIHVLALPSKAPKQLVRDIESTLMAAFGIAVDHKIISIAQLGQESLPVAADTTTTAQSRARIKSINAEVAGVYVTTTVSLELDDELFVGTSKGPASRTSRERLVAEATLDAISQYLQGAFTFALEDVHIARLGGESVAVSCVVLVTSMGEQAFAGSAMVRQSAHESIVRATLDAINRRLGFLTTT